MRPRLPGDLAEKWSRIRDGRDGGFRKSLGWWLKNRAGRYASGWALVPAEPDAHAKVARYAVKPPGDSEGSESAGLRGSAGFLTATREKENNHLGSNDHGERPGENPEIPATPQCHRCQAPLVWSDAKERGTCSDCWMESA
jgi:hypothetical protein